MGGCANKGQVCIRGGAAMGLEASGIVCVWGLGTSAGVGEAMKGGLGI